jgi:hypothetical protein
MECLVWVLDMPCCLLEMSPWMKLLVTWRVLAELGCEETTTKEAYRVRSIDSGSEVLLEARVLAVLEATLAVRLALGALVVALAVVLHVALAGSALGAGGSAGGCALLGLLVAGRLLVGVRLGLRFALGAGRLRGLLGLVLGLFLGLLILGFLHGFLLGLLILGLLLLRLLLLLGLSLLVVLLMVLLVTVVGIAVSRGPKEVSADRGDGERRDEPVAVTLAKQSSTNPSSKQHSPRQVRALLAVTTRAGVAARGELCARLDGGAGSTSPEALLQGASGSCAHERHDCDCQWMWCGWW